MKEISSPSIGQLDRRYVLDEDWFLMPPADDWFDPTGGLPEDPDVGDRYVSDATAEGWTTDYIYEWDGDEWVEYPPEEGWMIWMLFELIFYVFFSGGWMEVGSESFVNVTGDTMTGALIFGDASNNLQISADGTLTLAGTAKKWLAIRPDLDYTVITAQGKPTQVVVGVFHGYSMPVYNNNNEEMFFNIHVPGRWDGTSNPIVHLLVALAGTEDVSDNFKLQISWEHLTEGDVIPITSHDVEVEQAVLTDRNAQYSTYELQFAIDYDVDNPDDLTDHDDLAFRLRRIDATNPDITNEIIVLDYHVEFQVDKMFDGDAV